MRVLHTSIPVIITAITLLLLFNSGADAQPAWLSGVAHHSTGYEVSDEADLLVLLREWDMRISGNSNKQIRLRVVYKLLKDNAAGDASFSLQLHTFLKADRPKGWLIRKGEKAEELKKENVVEVTPDGYSDDRILLARFANLQVGDIVGYECSMEEKGWTSLSERIVFQRQRPVRLTRLRLEVPAGWEVRERLRQMEQFTYQQEANVHLWEGRDLAYRPDEPLMPPWSYLQRRIDITFYHPESDQENHYSSWDDVAVWYAGLANPQDVVTPEISGIANELVQNAATRADSLEALSRFVQRDIRYEAIEIRKGRYVPREAAETLHNRFGDCKDKTTLLRALLRSLDIESVAVLASVGAQVNDSLPTPFQFNHLIIAIPAIQAGDTARFSRAIHGGWLFFDPTNSSTPLGDIPYELQGNTLALCKPGAQILHRIPYPKPEALTRIYRLDGLLDTEGAAQIQVHIVDKAARAHRARYITTFATDGEQQEALRDYLQEVLPGAGMSDYAVKDMGDSLITTFQIKHASYLEDVPPYRLFRSGLFDLASLEALPRAERHHDIWFGAPEVVQIQNRWEVPQEWRFSVDTKPQVLDLEVVALESTTHIEGNHLRIESRYQTDGRLLEASQYSAARQLATRITKLNTMKILIEK